MLGDRMIVQLLTDTITSVCLSGVPYNASVRVEGIIAITMDTQRVLVLKIDREKHKQGKSGWSEQQGNVRKQTDATSTVTTGIHDQHSGSTSKLGRVGHASQGQVTTGSGENPVGHLLHEGSNTYQLVPASPSQGPSEPVQLQRPTYQHSLVTSQVLCKAALAEHHAMPPPQETVGLPAFRGLPNQSSPQHTVPPSPIDTFSCCDSMSPAPPRPQTALPQPRTVSEQFKSTLETYRPMVSHSVPSAQHSPAPCPTVSPCITVSPDPGRSHDCNTMVVAPVSLGGSLHGGETDEPGPSTARPKQAQMQTGLGLSCDRDDVQEAAEGGPVLLKVEGTSSRQAETKNLTGRIENWPHQGLSSTAQGLPSHPQASHDDSLGRQWDAAGHHGIMRAESAETGHYGNLSGKPSSGATGNPDNIAGNSIVKTEEGRPDDPIVILDSPPPAAPSSSGIKHDILQLMKERAGRIVEQLPTVYIDRAASPEGSGIFQPSPAACGSNLADDDDGVAMATEDVTDDDDEDPSFTVSHKTSEGTHWSNMKKHYKKKRYVCKICSRSFIYPAALKTHLLRHKSVKNPLHRCSICRMGFSSYSARWMHQQSHDHGGDEEDIECPVCHKVLKNKYTFKIHQRVHSSLRPYKCNVCQRSFKAKQSLIVHYRRHPDYKPHQCSACHQCFSGEEHLEAHRLVCTELPLEAGDAFLSRGHCRPSKESLRCKQCNNIFSNEEQLHSHSCTPLPDGPDWPFESSGGPETPQEKLPKCRECNRSFINEEELNCHSCHLLPNHAQGCGSHGNDLRGRGRPQKKFLKCPRCSKIFRREMLHSHPCHPQPKGCGPRGRPSKESLRCKHCDKTFRSRIKLHTHSCSTNIKEEFQCSLCLMKFVTMAKLKRHKMLIHSSDNHNNDIEDVDIVTDEYSDENDENEPGKGARESNYLSKENKKVCMENLKTEEKECSNLPEGNSSASGIKDPTVINT